MAAIKGTKVKKAMYVSQQTIYNKNLQYVWDAVIYKKEHNFIK